MCVDKCSLWVELFGETIELESYVYVAGDSEGGDWVSLVLKRASDAYGEYRVGLTQALSHDRLKRWSRKPAKDPENYTHTHNPHIPNHALNNHARIHHPP